jgi:Phage integrase, N-terminal SAM-like domain
VPTEIPATRLDIGLAIVRFIDSKKRKSPATVRNYTHILNEFLFQTSAQFVDEVTPKIIDEYITWLERDRQAEPKTIKNKTQVIVFMLKSDRPELLVQVK